MNPYIDGATGTHFNKLGIRDRDELRLVEYHVTDVRTAELALNPIPGQFDLDHMKKIHQHIFKDLYEWAGKERTINFSKRDAIDQNWSSQFAPASQIKEINEIVRQDLKSWNNLKGLDQEQFTAGMTTLFVKVNYMHPFPEGNGRTTQTMLTQLAHEAGYELKFDNVDKREWDHASARSMPQRHMQKPDIWRNPDATLIHDAFKKIIEPLRERTRPMDLER